MPGKRSPSKLADRRERAKRYRCNQLRVSGPASSIPSGHDLKEFVDVCSSDEREVMLIRESTVGADPLFQADPWKHATCPPLSGEKRVGNSAWDLYHPPVPSPLHAPSDVCGACAESGVIGDTSSALSSAYALIQAQNDTIAILTSRLDWLMFATMSGSEQLASAATYEATSVHLQKQVAGLAASLPNAIEASLNKKLPKVCEALAAEHFTSLEKFASLETLVKDITVNVADQLESSTRALHEEVDALKNRCAVSFKTIVTKQIQQHDDVAELRSKISEFPRGDVMPSSETTHLSVEPFDAIPAALLKVAADTCQIYRISCAEFLEMSRIAKINVPIVPAEAAKLLMLCNGVVDTDTESVDSELPSEYDFNVFINDGISMFCEDLPNNTNELLNVRDAAIVWQS